VTEQWTPGTRLSRIGRQQRNTTVELELTSQLPSYPGPKRRGVAAIGMVVACGFLLSYDVAVRPVASSAERTQIYGHASCDFGQSGSAIVDWIPPFDPPNTLQPPESALDIGWQQTGGAPAPDQLQLLARVGRPASGPRAVAQVGDAVAEATLLHQVQLDPHVGGEERRAAADEDRRAKLTELTDQSGPDRVRSQLRPADRDVAVC